MTVDNFAHVQLAFELYLTLVGLKKTRNFFALEGRAKELMVVLDVDLFAFKKDCEEVLLAAVESYVNEWLSSEETNLRKVVGDV